MTLEIHSPQQSVNERRGQRLAPLQTNFSRPTARPIQVTAARPQRPRPSDYQTDEGSGERVPLQSTPVKRQTSKTSLRNIFGRDKSARKSAADVKLSGIDEQKSTGEQPAPNNAGAAPLSPTLVATPKTNASAATLPTSPTTAASQRPKLPTKSRGKSSDDPASAGDLGWKPPPLFQAYPQSIKHDSLPVPSLSVDSILRMQATAKAKGITSSREDEKSSQNGDAAEETTTRKKKEEKERKRHLRTLSETVSKTEWSQKVYVLATAGYILQYAGSGKHDRLPEKMLQLGPKSVAFASDAIPGKHYVLQVTQTSDEEGSEGPKHHRFRFGFHRSHTRRMERSFLLVFDHPEDMNTWLLAVRAQIEARGGKKYISERADDGEPGHQLNSKPSIRQMITKDTKRYSTLIPPQLPASGEERDPSFSDQSRRNSYVSVNRRSIVLPPASESRSGSISTTHTEVTSPVSNSGRFYSTMTASSVPSVPSSDNVPKSFDMGSPTASGSTKRRSLHASPTQAMPTAAEMAAEIPRAQSTQPDSIYRSTSPPAPNFSVPSFSKRYTARFGPLQVPQFSQAPPALDVISNDPPADTLSAFPSPPHSPGKIPNGFGLGVMNESQQNQPAQTLAPPKPLRVSSSQDSLVDPVQNVDSKSHRLSRLPRNPLKSAANTLRPTTAVGGKPPSELHLLAEEQTSGQDQPRVRGSVMYQTDPNARLPPAGMGRRKSMPGLIGPPAAPPPNCPLPKIPS
ncbi:peptidase family M20/M25/M40 protein, partial [Aspergillus homomorphus CBS 101889]